MGLLRAVGVLVQRGDVFIEAGLRILIARVGVQPELCASEGYFRPSHDYGAAIDGL